MEWRCRAPEMSTFVGELPLGFRTDRSRLGTSIVISPASRTARAPSEKSKTVVLVDDGTAYASKKEATMALGDDRRLQGDLN